MANPTIAPLLIKSYLEDNFGIVEKIVIQGKFAFAIFDREETAHAVVRKGNFSGNSVTDFFGKWLEIFNVKFQVQFFFYELFLNFRVFQLPTFFKILKKFTRKFGKIP